MVVGLGGGCEAAGLGSPWGGKFVGDFATGGSGVGLVCVRVRGAVWGGVLVRDLGRGPVRKVGILL